MALNVFYKLSSFLNSALLYIWLTVCILSYRCHGIVIIYYLIFSVSHV